MLICEAGLVQFKQAIEQFDTGHRVNREPAALSGFVEAVTGFEVVPAVCCEHGLVEAYVSVAQGFHIVVSAVWVVYQIVRSRKPEPSSSNNGVSVRAQRFPVGR